MVRVHLDPPSGRFVFGLIGLIRQGICGWSVSSDWTEIDIVERETSVSLVAPREVLLTAGREVGLRSDIVPSQVH